MRLVLVSPKTGKKRLFDVVAETAREINAQVMMSSTRNTVAVPTPLSLPATPSSRPTRGTEDSAAGPQLLAGAATASQRMTMQSVAPPGMVASPPTAMMRPSAPRRAAAAATTTPPALPRHPPSSSRRLRTWASATRPGADQGSRPARAPSAGKTRCHFAGVRGHVCARPAGLTGSSSVRMAEIGTAAGSSAEVRPCVVLVLFVSAAIHLQRSTEHVSPQRLFLTSVLWTWTNPKGWLADWMSRSGLPG